MTSKNVLTDRTHRDGSRVHKSRQDVNRTVDPKIGCVEDKLQVVASTRNSSSNKSTISPMNRLVAMEMSKGVESKRKPPSVVARLMGLDDDLPAKEPALQSSRRNLRRSHSLDNLATTNRPQQQQEQHYSRTTPNIHIGPKETVEFKDVYEVSEDPLKRHHILGQNFPWERSSGNKSDTRIEAVRQKFMEAKRLATNENLIHSKQFQEALEVLSSNRELFLKFLEEPSPAFLKQLDGLDTTPAPPPTKRITVLKPIKSVENNGIRETRTHQVINEENELVMGKTHQRSYSADDNFSKSTRIVVLKPSPGKPNRTGARLTARAAPSEQTRRIDFHGGLQDDASILGSRELLHGSVQHMPESRHRRDESLISSTYSNGYGGDESSFSGSEVDYIDGGSPSDSDAVSPMSRHSWDYIRRHNSPHSASTFSRAHSHSPESSVIREAKKRLSERWAMVSYNEINQEQVPLRRSSTTLGEMLSLQVAKKEEAVAGIISVSSNRSSGTGNELAMKDACKSTLREYDENGKSSPRNLAKSKSVPVSSSIFDNVAVNAQSANSEGTPKVFTKSGRAKLSFTGKISSFFFPGNKRPTKEKTSLSSDSSGEIFGCIGHMVPQSDHNLGPDEQMAFCKDEADNSTNHAPCSTKQDSGSIEVPVSSDCVSGDVDEVKSNGDLKSIHDETSPTSILDTVFEDSNSNEPESSRRTSCTERVALRCPAIDSVARSFSWEDTNSGSPLLGGLKHSNVDDADYDYDELKCYSLVQEIVSSAGLCHLQLSMVFTGWYLPESPLDPALCDKFLDRKEEDAKSRERRSHQKLIFDCVNMALVEIGQDTLLCSYPWSRECLRTWREKLSETLGEEVWNIVSDWLYGDGSFAANKDDNAGIILERIMQEEVEGKGWIKLLTMETDEITEQIASEVLEDIVTDSVEHLSICCSEHGISMPVANL
ncbi:uncharacterized protein LOC127771003 isoform X1 [Oryza glaberrima]|uniref:uncharacterized protein LOC127771003 isoform X1 n=1 Tax=Oryza glaberrima TaxID=4538 RepID=UPI00224C323E|nr:uncharacterized protein LOC127771003 isoform X1 [Oryza glaberrima]XP_052152747.1 uncharacterized protein LOC127771003 isoform X1 [Oryza glaberrima]XP_052152748.1 uncharacterized protein LOC127771003 isoform X1 [Oryza glaberrima]XP_052152749.1 uncharacterized protein LOC127771003 isoform X1 [Oryza glaberrima]XP_052152750.1 uncharacterized protein LOC127771003 isoform X1 [Oryza glaberrima]XP_052152751.1 uncharacterized protein LOC127771003 isoform X1 [Oryza glaberrima]XP_052152752.1 uncharac